MTDPCPIYVHLVLASRLYESMASLGPRPAGLPVHDDAASKDLPGPVSALKVIQVPPGYDPDLSALTVGMGMKGQEVTLGEGVVGASHLDDHVCYVRRPTVVVPFFRSMDCRTKSVPKPSKET